MRKRLEPTWSVYDEAQLVEAALLMLEEDRARVLEGIEIMQGLGDRGLRLSRGFAERWSDFFAGKDPYLAAICRAINEGQRAQGGP